MTDLAAYNDATVRDSSTDCPDTRNESKAYLALSGITVKLDHILGVGLGATDDPNALETLRGAAAADDSPFL